MNSILQNQEPVEFFSAERIKIEIDGQQILWRDMTLKIDSKIGEHTVGKIRYIASLQQINIYDAAIDKDEDIKIIISGRSNISNENGVSNDKIFLNGIIDDIKLSEIKTGSLVVEITCISKSVLLDRIPRYRSFQDPALTYSAIVEEINKNYGANGERIISVGEDMKEVPRMTIQYNETDWEYLKRLASYTGSPIIPYYDKVLVGFLKNQVTQTPNTTYSQYVKSKRNKRTMYKITGTEVYAVSTPIKLKTRNRASGEDVENDYFVIESKIYNEGNTLKCEYTLGKQTDYFVDPIPHEKIRGAVNNDGNGRFTNPDKRNFTLGNSQSGANNGKPMYNFTLDSEEFIISVGRVINMSSKGTVDISSLSTSNITSTGADVNVSGKSQANISSQSSKLALTPQSGTLTTSSKLDIQSSETNVVGGSEMNIKGGKVKVH